MVYSVSIMTVINISIYLCANSFLSTVKTMPNSQSDRYIEHAELKDGGPRSPPVGEWLANG